MTTMIIEIKNPKAKKLLKDLEKLDLLKITNSKESDNDLGWLHEKRPHAKRILNAYKEASLAADGKIELKTLDQLLSEL